MPWAVSYYSLWQIRPEEVDSPQFLQCLPSCPLISTSARLSLRPLHRHCLCQDRQESPSDLFFFIPFVGIFIDSLDPSFLSPWTSSLIQLAMYLLYFSPTLCLLSCLMKPVVSETEAAPLLLCQPCFCFLSEPPEVREWQLHIPGLRKLCPSLS